MAGKELRLAQFLLEPGSNLGQATDPVIRVLQKEEKPDVQSNSCSNISYGSAKKADAFSEIGLSIQNGLSKLVLV